MICEHQEWMTCPFQPVLPLLESYLDVQEISVANVIVLLCQGKFLVEVCTWMEMGWIPLLEERTALTPEVKASTSAVKGFSGSG